MAFLGKEPAVILGAISEVIKAIIPALIIFGWLKWTPEQVASVMFVVGVLVSSLTVILTRSNTVPTVVADKQIEIAKAADVSTPKSLIIQQAKESL